MGIIRPMITTSSPLWRSFLAGTGCVGMLCAVGLTAAEPANLTPIFNGRDLAGWKAPDPNPFWRVEDGVLIGENDAELRGSMLYTEAAYGDFVMEAEVRWEGEIDSGFIVRRPELQLQIGVSRSLKRDMTCSFYTGGQEGYPEAGQAKGTEGLLKSGDWNRIRLRARGDTFAVWLNGKQVTDYTNRKYAGPGPIGLQIHGGLKMKVEFRNVRLTAIE